MPPASTPHSLASSSPENGAWSEIGSGWRQLFGSFPALGVSLEQHDFTSETPLDWGRSFHPGSIELCLNLQGTGQFSGLPGEPTIGAESWTLYAVGPDGLAAHRTAGERHAFFTFEFSREYLTQRLAGADGALAEAVRELIFEAKGSARIGPVLPFNSGQQAFAKALSAPPLLAAALPLWFQGKVFEALALFLFGPHPENFCTRQKRLAQERVQRATAILTARLDNPPSLEALGREIGVSQFHLSRTFAEEMRMSIPQFIRRTRIERAAELLREGKCNVTEAAFAVGYSSLGHFSKSFCEVMGCCPTLYGQAKNLTGKR